MLVIRLPLARLELSTLAVRLYSASSVLFVSTYSEMYWILEKRLILSSLQNRMLFISI